MKNFKNLKNNKGFSLVELIIVVAIMAILIGILAPQYLKYVERTRLTADNDYIDSVRKAIETIASDPSVDLTSVSNYEVTLVSGTAAAVKVNGQTGDGTDAMTVAIAKIVKDYAASTNTNYFKSKTYTNGSTVTITIDLATGEINVQGQTFGS